MLRRHASGFRALLMLADAVLAFVLLVVLSLVRFGPTWLDVWRPLLAQPALFGVGYSIIWVAILWLHGLYRPRARWSIRSEAIALARATVVLGLLTGTIL